MLGRNGYKNRIELLQGTQDMLILQTLQGGTFARGMALCRRCGGIHKRRFGRRLTGLSPALHRLERPG
jgi:PadR family transcriptional regulator, regulatory protein PadR